MHLPIGHLARSSVSAAIDMGWTGGCARSSRYASAAEEVERLRSELADKEGEVRDARQAEQEFAAEIERQEQEWARERQQLKVGGRARVCM